MLFMSLIGMFIKKILYDVVLFNKCEFWFCIVYLSYDFLNKVNLSVLIVFFVNVLILFKIIFKIWILFFYDIVS